MNTQNNSNISNINNINNDSNDSNFSYFYIIFIILVIVIIILLIIYLLYSFPGMFLSDSNTREGNYGISDIIGEYEIFNDIEIEQIHDSVDLMKIDNIPLTKNSVMDVVGHPTYMVMGKVDYNDTIDTNSDYNIQKEITNKQLLDYVSFIYPIILKKLEYITQTKCIYPSYNTKYKHQDISYLYSLPGFHIFKGGSWLGSGWSVASMHVDLQFDKLDFDNRLSSNMDTYEFDKEDVFSFTIPISMPDNSGLYIYRQKREDVNSILPLAYTLKNYPKNKIIYKTGNLYIHDGLHFHMISPFNSDINKDRITIQGHGIYCKTTQSYWIYW